MIWFDLPYCNIQSLTSRSCIKERSMEGSSSRGCCSKDAPVVPGEVGGPPRGSGMMSRERRASGIVSEWLELLGLESFKISIRGSWWLSGHGVLGGGKGGSALGQWNKDWGAGAEMKEKCGEVSELPEDKSPHDEAAAAEDVAAGVEAEAWIEAGQDTERGAAVVELGPWRRQKASCCSRAAV